MKRLTKVLGATLMALSFMAVSCDQDAIDDLLNNSGKTEEESSETEDDSNKNSVSDESDDESKNKDEDSDEKKDDTENKDADSDEKKDDADKTDADSDEKKDDTENKDPEKDPEHVVIYTVTVENEEYDHATVTVTGEGNEKTITVTMDEGSIFAGLTVNDTFVTNENPNITVDAMCTSATYSAILEADTKVNVYRVIMDAQNYETNELFTAAADGTLYLCNAMITGGKGTGNAFIPFNAAKVVISNVIIQGLYSNNKIYNVFEQSGEQTPIESLTVTNLTVDGTNITHNFINAYTFAENAVVTVKDSDFDIYADNNIARFANRQIKENITINFENINWSYDETSSSYDKKWASIVLFQNWNSEDYKLAAFTGMKFNFTDCYYKGTKVTEAKIDQPDTLITTTLKEKNAEGNVVPFQERRYTNTTVN